VPKRLTLGLGPPSGVSTGRLSGVGALWDCVSRVCGGGGGCAGGGVPLGAGPCCPDVGRCLSGVNIIIIIPYINKNLISLTPQTHPRTAQRTRKTHTQKAPTLFRGRYHSPKPETAAVQSVVLPWLGLTRTGKLQPSIKDIPLHPCTTINSQRQFVGWSVV